MASIANLAITLSVNQQQFSAGMNQAQNTVKKFANQTSSNGVLSMFDNLRNGTTQFIGQITNATSSTGGLISVLGSGVGVAGMFAAGLAGIGAAAGFGVKLAADLEQSQIAFTVLLKSAADAKIMLAELRAFASSTPFDTTETTDAARQLVAFGTEGKQVLPTLRMLGDVAAGTGSKLGDLTYLFGTLRAQGRAYAVDIRQFAMRGIPIYEELAKVLKKDISAVKQFVEDGKVGFAEVQLAFQNMTQNGGAYEGMTEAQSKSLLGRFTALKDNVFILFTDIGQQITESFDLKDSLESVNSFVINLRSGITSIKPTLDFIASATYASLHSIYEVGRYIAHMYKVVGVVIDEALGGESVNVVKHMITSLKEFFDSTVGMKLNLKLIGEFALATFQVIDVGAMTVTNAFKMVGIGIAVVVETMIKNLETVADKFYDLAKAGEAFNLPGSENVKIMAIKAEQALKSVRLTTVDMKKTLSDSLIADPSGESAKFFDSVRMKLDQMENKALNASLTVQKTAKDIGKAFSDIAITMNAQLPADMLDMANQLNKNALTPLEEFQKKLESINTLMLNGNITPQIADKANAEAFFELERSLQKSSLQPVKAMIAGSSEAVDLGLQYSMRADMNQLDPQQRIENVLQQIKEVNNRQLATAEKLSMILSKERIRVVTGTP